MDVDGVYWDNPLEDFVLSNIWALTLKVIYGHLLGLVHIETRQIHLDTKITHIILYFFNFGGKSQRCWKALCESNHDLFLIDYFVLSEERKAMLHISL